MTKFSPLLHLPHKLLQLCSLVLDSFGEVLSDVNVASGQKLGLPKDWHCVSWIIEMVDYQSGDAWPSYVGIFQEGIGKKHFLKCVHRKEVPQFEGYFCSFESPWMLQQLFGKSNYWDKIPGLGWLTSNIPSSVASLAIFTIYSELALPLSQAIFLCKNCTAFRNFSPINC